MSKNSEMQSKSPVAGTSLDDVLKRREVTDEQGAAGRDFLIGGALLLVGLTVTLLTVANVFVKGYGVFVFAWGPVLYGAGRCFRGFFRLRSGR